MSRSTFSFLTNITSICFNTYAMVFLLTKSMAFYTTCSRLYGSSMWLLPCALTSKVPYILNLELSTSWKALTKVLTKSSMSSLFPVTASGPRHFWAMYKNLLSKLMSCSSSNKLILAFSLHNFLSWSILPCSLVVNSGYSILSLSGN